MEEALLSDLVLTLHETLADGSEGEMRAWLQDYVDAKDHDIYKIAALGYKGFMKSTQGIQDLQADARRHKHDIERFNAKLQSTGRKIVEARRQRNVQQKISDAAKRAAGVAVEVQQLQQLVKSSRHQLDAGHIYLALVAAKEAGIVQSHVKKILAESDDNHHGSHRLRHNNNSANKTSSLHLSSRLEGRLTEELAEIFTEAKALLDRGLEVWAEAVHAITLKFGGDLLHSALDATVGRSIKSASLQDSARLGSMDENEGAHRSHTNTNCPDKSGATLGRGVGSAAAATAAVVAVEHRLDLTKLKQFFSSYQLLGLEHVARETYQNIRLPVLRSSCVDFCNNSIKRREEGGAGGHKDINCKSRHELIRQIPLVCTRIAAAFVTDDLVQRQVSPSLLPPSLLAKQWGLSCKTVCKMCEMVRYKFVLFVCLFAPPFSWLTTTTQCIYNFSTTAGRTNHV